MGGVFSIHCDGPHLVEKLRQRFTPEVVVSSDMTVRMPVQRRIEAGLTDYLLDYDQEAAVKADLDLPDEDQSLTSDFKLNIINGVAGSGKTLILLYRLRLLYPSLSQQTLPGADPQPPAQPRYGGALCAFERGLPESVEWRTFNAWCYHHWMPTRSGSSRSR